LRAQRIEQASRPRQVAGCKQIRPRLHDRTEPVQQRRTSFQAEQLVGFAHLKRALKRSAFGAAQHRCVHSEGVAGVIRKATAFKPAQARERKSL
jgi:hypothetical protein